MNRSRVLTIALALLLVCLVPQSASAAYGDLDASFGVNGRVSDLRFAPPVAVEIQPDRKIVIAGSTPSKYEKGRIARLLRSGAPDKTFGTDGYVALPEDGFAFDAKLLGDGRIAVLSSKNRIVVFRADGSLDTAFGHGGVLEFGDQPTSFKAASIETQLGSKILVSGALNASSDARLIRLDRSGAIDTTFADAGMATVANGDGGLPGQAPISTTPGGEILLGLGYPPSDESYAGGIRIAKFTANGEPVTAFGKDGIALDSQPNTRIYGAARTRKIVVASDGSFVATTRLVVPADGHSGGLNQFNSFWFRANGETRNGLPSRFTVQAAAPVNGAGLATAMGNRITVFTPKLTPDHNFGSNGSNSVTVGAASDWTHLATDVDGSVVAVGGRSFESGQAVRFLGRNGGKAAIEVEIRSEVRRRYFYGKRARGVWLRKLTGTASPKKGLKRVEVAIRRTALNPVDGYCDWATKSGTKFARGRDCDKPLFMPAKGLASWRFTLRRPLPPGDYDLYVRATAVDGRFNRLNDDADTFRSFTVKRLLKKTRLASTG